ncbi:hypothetical protein AJ80_05962 [Polytolypa hystricis UAMH7299]|uniref:RTA1 domain-containing protein n=1 Tax=Polytolypa hystricis (strain UAMH7299) TaxID=1447883 RepID=A0A2B7Y0I3_POLH7|nr:hypothetical protein AJ80_05962 [Polytolypa hystricis UAMH7299]
MSAPPGGRTGGFKGGPGTEGFSYFQYYPVKGASAVFAVLWVISGALHVWQNNLRYKTHRLGFLLPWAPQIFMVGYIVREVCAHGKYGDLNLFITATVMLFVAPPLYLAANSIFLGRLLYYIPWLSPMHPGRVVSTFLGLDFIVEVLTSSGASIASNLSNPPDRLQTGSLLIKISLFAQLVLFFSFFVVVATFHYRVHKAGIRNNRSLRVMIYMLYASTVLITIRNIYRLTEYFEGWGSEMGGVEAYFWCLDAVPTLLNSAMMNVFPPASYLPRSRLTYLARDCVTERQGPGWVDNRPVWKTIVDPFNFASWKQGNEKDKAFWDEDDDTELAENNNKGGGRKEST